MQMRSRLLVACGAIVALAAGCDSDKSITGTPPATALVRFVNATQSDTVDVAVSGLVNTANSKVLFGGATGCLSVNAASPGLSFRKYATTTDLTGFTASFTAGHKYWVVAITGASGIQFVALDMAFTPASGAAGIASLNAINGAQNYDLHITASGAAPTANDVVNANLAFGTPSAFASNTVPFNTATPPVAQPQGVQFTTAGTTTVARNHGNVTFTVGTTNLAIIAPGAAATPATLRSILNGGC